MAFLLSPVVLLYKCFIVIRDISNYDMHRVFSLFLHHQAMYKFDMQNESLHK